MNLIHVLIFVFSFILGANTSTANTSHKQIEAKRLHQLQLTLERLRHYKELSAHYESSIEEGVWHENQKVKALKEKANAQMEQAKKLIKMAGPDNKQHLSADDIKELEEKAGEHLAMAIETLNDAINLAQDKGKTMPPLTDSAGNDKNASAQVVEEDHAK